MAGPVGFEPTNAEIKTPCLTTWRRPNLLLPIEGLFSIELAVDAMGKYFFPLQPERAHRVSLAPESLEHPAHSHKRLQHTLQYPLKMAYQTMLTNQKPCRL